MVTYILKGKGRSVEERRRIPKRAIVAELKPEEGDIVIERTVTMKRKNPRQKGSNTEKERRRDKRYVFVHGALLER